MNYPAKLFRDLLSTWQQDVCCERIEHLAAEIAAESARAPSSVCLGLLEKDALKSLYGLVYLFDGYGLILRQRYREQNDGIFVFLDQKQPALSEFRAAKVVARRRKPSYADITSLPKAA